MMFHPEFLPNDAAGNYVREAAPPACRHCGAPAITGEGAEVCRPCVLRFGSVAAHPERLTQGEALMLIEAHGDRVFLGLCIAHGRLEWRWKERES